MHDRQRRQFEMLVRVRQFGDANARLFAALPVARQTFAEVRAATESLLATNMKKMSASTAARADRRTDARDALIATLRRVLRLVKNLRAEGRDIRGFAFRRRGAMSRSSPPADISPNAPRRRSPSSAATA